MMSYDVINSQSLPNTMQNCIMAGLPHYEYDKICEDFGVECHFWVSIPKESPMHSRTFRLESNVHTLHKVLLILFTNLVHKGLMGYVNSLNTSIT